MNSIDHTGIHCPILAAASLAGVLINLMVGWLDGVSPFLSTILWLVGSSFMERKCLKNWNLSSRLNFQLKTPWHIRRKEIKKLNRNIINYCSHRYKLTINFQSRVCLFMARQPPSGPGSPHCRGFTITHDAPQAVGLLWTSDQLVTETSTWQHTILTTDIHVFGGIRTPQSQQASGCRPTP